MKPAHDLAWGDPIIVRQALAETLGYESLLGNANFTHMGYPPHAGQPKLIEQLKDMAYRQSGHRPKHLYVTCGATGALNASLYALRTLRTEYVTTNKRYYPFYPSIIHGADMVHIEVTRKGILYPGNNSLSIVDSPSAPEGLVKPFYAADIWDSAYGSATYTSDMAHVPEKWTVMCGSLSKTLGLAGLRLGWVSTDSDQVAASLLRHATTSSIGMSSVSMGIAEEVLERLDLDRFETLSRGYLDDNRAQVQKLFTKLGQDVPTRGMFAILKMGQAEETALRRAGVKWLSGSAWGEDDTWARLSLGQSREVVRDAVRATLKRLKGSN